MKVIDIEIERYLNRLKRKLEYNEVENFDDISEKEIMLLILYKLELIESFMINYL